MDDKSKRAFLYGFGAGVILNILPDFTSISDLSPDKKTQTHIGYSIALILVALTLYEVLL